MEQNIDSIFAGVGVDHHPTGAATADAAAGHYTVPTMAMPCHDPRPQGRDPMPWHGPGLNITTSIILLLFYGMNLVFIIFYVGLNSSFLKVVLH